MSSSQELGKAYPSTSMNVGLRDYDLETVQCPLNPKHLVRRNKLPNHLARCKNYIQCPLDPKHELRRKNLPFHILKCKKNFPNKVQCPYGHNYYLEKHEMANHVQTCHHNPRIAQAEEMLPHQPRNEKTPIAPSVLKDSLRRTHQEIRDSLRITKTKERNADTNSGVLCGTDNYYKIDEPYKD